MSLKFENSLKRLTISTDELIDSILNDDTEKISKNLSQWRFIRSTMSLNFQKSLLELKGEVPVKKIKNYQNQLSLLNKKEDVIKQWLHRFDATKTFQELLRDKDGIEYLVDSLLPSTWDFEKDLIFLVSNYASEIAEVLKAKGQNTIFFINRQDYNNNDINLIEVHELEQVQKIVSTLFPVPQRALVLEPLDIVSDPEIVSSFASNFKTILERNFYNVRTAQGLATEWAFQKSKNLWAFPQCHSIIKIEHCIKNKATIIALPGPSLLDDITRLKENRKKFTLVAAAQACVTLSKFNITPDFIFIIDPADIYYTISHVDKMKLKGLILYDTCHPIFFEDPDFTRFIIKNDHHIFNTTLLIEDHNFDHSANGVAIVMFKICAAFNASVIGLMGLDLNLSRGHYVGYQGAKSKKDLLAKKAEKEKPGFIWIDVLGRYVKKEEVISNSGEVVDTKRDYLIFLEFFEDIIKENQDIMPPIINFSKHGAKIQGANYIPFEKFLATYAVDEIGSSQEIEPILDIQDRSKIVLDIALPLLNSVEKLRTLASSAIKELKREKSTKIEKLNHMIVKEIEKQPALGFLVRSNVDYFLDDLRTSGYGKADKRLSLELYKAIRSKTLGLKKGLRFSIEKLDK